MTIERKPTRYAHSDGHTDVCYSEDGKRLITCGTDGDIRIWLGFEDDDPVQACVGEWSLCVRQKGEHLYIATDKNNVQTVTFPESERDGILARFTAHVNHMDLGKAHNLIATAAEDMEVKVLNLSEPKEPQTVASFSDLPGPPLSVALCPRAKLLAVSFGDGQLRIWDIESHSLLKEIECVPKTNSFMNAALLCRIHFEPTSGRTLAYPHNNTVVIADTTSWSNKLILTCPEIESAYSIVQYSPCGNLMAASTQQGDLIVWEIATQNILGISKHPKSISLCAMVWNPNGNGEIAFCDVQGQLGIVANCVVRSAPEIPLEKPSEDVETIVPNEVDFDGFQFDDDDDDNENAVSLEKLKNEIMGTEEPELNFDKESSRGPTPRPRTPEIPLQNVFMPSSTPEHLNPRYLCWNDVGIVRSFGTDENSEDGGKSIEVEFHDASLHNSMMIQNYQNYTMGTVSSTALVIANASQITVIPLSGGSKEWILNLPEDEEIICVAVSDHLICFATSNYLIRVYSIYGTQKAVLSVPGPVVSMSAYNCLLLTAYHYGAARKGDQCINLMLTNLEGMSIENKNINSALRAETTLLWLGFTDVGTPAMQDSYGILSLFPELSNIWIPFCNTTKYHKNPTDGFFITSVFESLQSIRGIRCRGSIYPGFIPRPTLSELPIEPPFVELTTEKSQLEANLFTWSTLRVDDVEKKIKETSLKTFALACKNNLDQRALEFIKMIANPQMVMLATKYASKLNRRRLAEKLREMASSLQDDDYEDLSVTQNTISTPSINIKPVHKRLVLNSAAKHTPKNKSSNDQTTIVVHADVHNTNSATSLSSASKYKEEDTFSETNTSTVNDSIVSQESDYQQSQPKNPFLKSLKKSAPAPQNPLSLTDKFAGFEGEKSKEKAEKSILNKNGTAEKRKQRDFETEKPKDKQRKLDKFMYSKRP